MKDLMSAWQSAHRQVWGPAARIGEPTAAAIITNSGHRHCAVGTPVYVGVGTGQQAVSLGDSLIFDIDHAAQTITVRSGQQSYALPALTDEQKAYFGVDFGGQFSS